MLIFENVMLYNMTGKLAADAGPVDIDKAAIRRAGRDISLITYGGSLWKTLEAAAAARRREDRGGGDRSAQPASARRRHHHGVGEQDTPRRHCRRGLAQRQSGGGDRHAHRRAGVLGTRRADRPCLQRGGSDPLCPAS